MSTLICPSCRSALRTAQAAIRMLDDSDVTQAEHQIAAEELAGALDRLRGVRRLSESQTDFQ